MISEEEWAVTIAAPGPGTVFVSVEVNTSVERVWGSLTLPTVASHWFGTLSRDLAQAESARLDFGDGDFFELESITIAPPNLLQYDWRFLGIGPLDTITWHIEPVKRGCLVTVTDSEPERSRKAGLALREGWLDFTSRLVEFHSTGNSTRYDWRRELDVSIELPCAAEDAWNALFALEAQSRWLPFGSVIQTGAQAGVADNAEPRLLLLDDVDWQASPQVEFNLSCEEWEQPTNCQMNLSARRASALLNISHNGWENISRDEAQQLRQRRRFCALWIEAARRARRIIERKQVGT